MRFHRWIGTAVVLMTFGIGASIAQDSKYPVRAVHIIVPFTSGTNADIVARIYGEKLSAHLGQPFVIENRPGAGGVVAAQSLLSAAPDGYSLMFVSGAHGVNPTFHKNLPYDTITDFAGIALVGSSPTLLVVDPALGVTTLREFVSLVSSRPGKLNFGSAGVGSGTHLACQGFLNATHLDMAHVPYKGVQEVIVEVIAARLQLGCPPVGLAAAQVKAGKLRALSVMSSERTSLLPDVPTSAEAGLPGVEFGIWYGLVASRKVPKQILELLAKEMAAISAEPEIAQKMLAQGVVSKVIQLSDFDAFIKSDIERVKGVMAPTNSAQRR